MISTFGERLAEAMNARQIDADSLAVALGISTRTVHRWLDGTHEPLRVSLQRAALADALAVNLGWLNGRDIPRDKGATDGAGVEDE